MRPRHLALIAGGLGIALQSSEDARTFWGGKLHMHETVVVGNPEDNYHGAGSYYALSPAEVLALHEALT